MILNWVSIGGILSPVYAALLAIWPQLPARPIPYHFWSPAWSVSQELGTVVLLSFVYCWLLRWYNKVIITRTVFQMRKLRLRKVKQRVKLAQLGMGAELGFKPRFVRLQCFSLPTLPALASRSPQGSSCLSGVVHETLGLKCPCPSNSSRRVILTPRQKVSPTSLLSYYFICLLS